MGLDLVEIGSFGGVFIENFADERLELLGEVLRKDTLAFEYFFICNILIFGLKGSSATGQFIKQHTNCPNIDSLIITVSFDNLRRNIVDSATEGLPLTKINKKLLNGRIGRPAEVTHLDNLILDENVFGLDITVDYVFVVHVFQRGNALLCVVRSLLLAEFDLD
jgi:hypothetical protein